MGLDGGSPPISSNRPCQEPPGCCHSGGAAPARLKSRPIGWTPSFPGTKHRPGYLPHPPQGTPLPALPPAAGRPPGCAPLLPPRLFPGSAVPPPWAEPLVPLEEDTQQQVAEAEASRSNQPEGLINRLVFDAWLPSSSPALAEGHPAYAPDLPAWYAPDDPSDTTLVFESRFECGNLRRAIQVRPHEYDLVLQPDLNTRGHTQWYFFAFTHAPRGVPLTFNLINLLKEDSLYNKGLLPLVHSEELLSAEGLGWHHSGSRVAYYANSIRRGRRGTYHTLTFTLTLTGSAADWVHLAHYYPYTFTDLQRSLAVLMTSSRVASFTSRSRLATSLAGNPVDMLTITAPEGEAEGAAGAGAVPLSQRKVVVLSARVHPGESNASWMMAGAIAFLTSAHPEADELRERYVFKVVPMLNPDGVVVGNYRCSLAGLDLNRVYQDPGGPGGGGLVPGVAAYKALLAQVAEEQQLALLVDFHGHSRKAGIFMYGCEKRPRDAAPVAPGWPVPGSRGGLPGVPAAHQERLFPALLAANVPHLFSYRACDFKVQRSKAGTGRVVSFRQLGLVNAFTLEASFGGGAAGSNLAGTHFNTAHLEELGAAVVRTLADYWAPRATSSVPDLLAALAAAARSGKSAAAWGERSGAEEEGGGEGAASPWLDLVTPAPGGEGAGDTATDSDDESSDPEPPTPARAPQLPPEVGVADASSAAVRPAVVAAAEAAATAVTLLQQALVAPSSSSSSGSSNCSSKGGSQKQLAAAGPGPSNPASEAASQLQNFTSAAVASALAAAAAAAAGAGQCMQKSGQTCTSGASSSRAGRGSSGGGGGASAAAAASSLASSLGLPQSLVASLFSSSSSSSGTASGASARNCNTASADPGGLPTQAALVAALQQHYLAAATGGSGAGGGGSMAPVGVGALLSLAAAATGTSLVESGSGSGSAAAATAASPSSGVKGSKAAGKKKKGTKRRATGRYGNPALLAAERAKAEQGLLAALPLLAAGGDEGEEGEGEEEEDSGEEEEGGAGPLYALDLQPSSPGRGGWRSSPVTPRGISGGGAAGASGASAAGLYGEDAGPPSPSTARQRVATGRRSYVLDVDRYVDHLHKEQRRLGGLVAATAGPEAEPTLPGSPTAAAASAAEACSMLGHPPARSSLSAGAIGRSGHAADVLGGANAIYGELQLPARPLAKGTGSSSSSTTKQPGLVRAVSAAAATMPMLGAVPVGAVPSGPALGARAPGAGASQSPAGSAAPRTRVATAIHSSVRWADQGSQ